MSGRLFIVNEKVARPRSLDIGWATSALFVYQAENGAVSFLFDEAGRVLMRTLLEDACVVTRRGELSCFNTTRDINAYHAVIASRSDLCFYGPDSDFLAQARMLGQHDESLKKRALNEKYGKRVEAVAMPRIGAIGSVGISNDSDLEWVMAHSEGYAFWQCVTGAEKQGRFFGPERDRKYRALTGVCRSHGIAIVELESTTSLPQW
jgi:hypothetical protein